MEMYASSEKLIVKITLKMWQWEGVFLKMGSNSGRSKRIHLYSNSPGLCQTNRRDGNT